MIVGVISDTHRVKSMIDKVSRELKDVDCIIHLGDNVDDGEYISKKLNKDVYIVNGNCDMSGEYLDERIIDIKGIKIFITHGHRYNVKYTINNLYYKCKELKVNIGLYGHSHVEGIEKDKDLIIMNPGSVSLSRGNGNSYGIIKIDDNKKVQCEIKYI